MQRNISKSDSSHHIVGLLQYINHDRLRNIHFVRSNLLNLHQLSVPQGLRSIDLFTASIPITSRSLSRSSNNFLCLWKSYTRNHKEVVFICELVLIDFRQTFPCLLSRKWVCVYTGCPIPHIRSTNHVNMDQCGVLWNEFDTPGLSFGNPTLENPYRTLNKTTPMSITQFWQKIKYNLIVPNSWWGWEKMMQCYSTCLAILHILPWGWENMLEF